MKLVCENLEQCVDFSKNNVWQIIVENEHLFYQLCKSFIEQCDGLDGPFNLYKNLSTLSIKDYCLPIYNFYDLTLNNKKIENLINKKIINIINTNDFLCELNEINKNIFKILDKMQDYLDIDVEILGEFNAENIIKVANIKPNNEKKLLNQIVNYIRVNTELQKIKIVIIIGVNNFLFEEEINLLTKSLNYLDINVLFLENSFKYKIKDCETIIIDEDLCEI